MICELDINYLLDKIDVENFRWFCFKSDFGLIIGKFDIFKYIKIK